MNNLYDGVHPSDNYIAMVMSRVGLPYKSAKRILVLPVGYKFTPYVGLPYDEQLYTEKATVDEMKLAWAQAYAEDVQRRKPILHGWKYRQHDYSFPRTCKDAFGAYICDVERHICDVERHTFFWGHE